MSETQETNENVAVGAESAVATNPFSRLISVITEPSAAMRGALAKPGQWWVPLLLTILGLIIFMVIAGDVVHDFSIQQMQNRVGEMVEQGRLTQEQADQVVERQSNGTFMKLGLYLGPIINTFIMKFIMTLLALLVGNVILGGSMKFGHYWSILWWAGVISFISFVLSAILMNMTGDIYGAQLGLGIISKADPQSTLHKILQVFDIFRIWEAVVAGIGVAIAAKVDAKRGILWMLVVFLGLTLITSLLTGTAM